MRGASEQLAKLAGKNFQIGPGYAANIRENMARVVLFDYVLRERAVNQQTGETISAGPVEQAMNDGFTVGKLAKSPLFQDAIGKLTPARIEAFLNNNEARSPKFNEIVQNTLSPAKVNVADNQPVQQQLQQELAPNKTEPKVLGGP